MANEQEARQLLEAIILGDDATRPALLEQLADQGEPLIKDVVAAWRVGEVFEHQATSTADSRVALLKTNDGFLRISDGSAYEPSTGEDPKVNRASRSLRKELSTIVEFLDLSSPDLAVRIATVQKMGLSGKAEFLPILQERLELQDDPRTLLAFEESINQLILSTGEPADRAAAIQKLGEMKSFPARDSITAAKEEAAAAIDTEGNPEIVAAADVALEKIDTHQRHVERLGTLFRGLSSGSVLLLVAYGLAITFGQMGVINMAHGEFIAIGGYTTYLVQNIFEATFGTGSFGFESYFLVALPISFMAAALVGIVLERGVIRFLYKRPLESLLATWGVSMILQQLFRMNFGAANVAVASPEWLSGSFIHSGVTMSYNRLAVIVFAIIVVLATFVLLRKTNWGLHVRATMQNRQMAACLGVKSARVNMLTFAFGSGLAGLSGALLSQIGNVGPSMGQGYIVDSFMVVVIGGVGNLLGTALSALGIGLVDQILQPILGPVMGKITVLFCIILFLQFKPGGLFPARSRLLDED